MKKASILCFSPPGRETALKLKNHLKTEYPNCSVTVFVKGRFASESSGSEERKLSEKPKADGEEVIPPARSLSDWTEEHFAQDDCMIFVGAAGIAVRAIGRLAESKKTDPAVLVADERLQYIIPILSGHLGGANEIARRLSAPAGAKAILTTATDIQEKMAPDVFAQKNGLKIMDFTAAKLVAAALVRGEKVTVYTDAGTEGRVPEEIRIAALDAFSEYQGGGAVVISAYKPELKDRPEVLWLVPRTVYLGVGLKAGKSQEAVARAAYACLEKSGIEAASLAGIASIDIKNREEGLRGFADRMHLPLSFYTAEELNCVKGDFTKATFVKQITGTDNVCERSAMLAAGASAGKNGSVLLLEPKTALDGVTAALAMKKGTIRFE